MGSKFAEHHGFLKYGGESTQSDQEKMTLNISEEKNSSITNI